jgi:hypothetical protein
MLNLAGADDPPGLHRPTDSRDAGTQEDSDKTKVVGVFMTVNCCVEYRSAPYFADYAAH